MRRRWARIAFTVIATFVAVLVFANITSHHRWTSADPYRLPEIAFGFLALPMLYVLARRLEASRTTALWAMAMLGGNVAWLVAVRHGNAPAVLPLLTTLTLLCYLMLNEGSALASLWLACAAAGLLLVHPLVGLGLLVGLMAHALIWMRPQPNGPRTVRVTSLLCLLHLVALILLGGHTSERLAGLHGQTLLTAGLLTNAWLLPLPALPLLWMAIFANPAHRWHPIPSASLLAVPIVGILLAVVLRPTPVHLDDLIGIAPLAALWLAMGLAKLQVRTPSWVWLPVAGLLVLTTLPQGAINWALQAAHVQGASSILHVQHGPMLTPLYPYITQELAGESCLQCDTPATISAPRTAQP